MSEQIIISRTGDVVDLDAPTETLATFLADVREMEATFREAKQAVSAVILARLDQSASWTAHLPGGIKVSAPSPSPTVEYDELALRSALLELVDEGLITAEAVDRAVEPCVTYKARAAGVKALSKLGGRVAEVIDAHAREVDKRRTVSVTRA